jgi:hypothetical protein
LFIHTCVTNCRLQGFVWGRITAAARTGYVAETCV